MKTSNGRYPQSSESLGKVVGFQDNLAGAFAGAEERPEFAVLGCAALPQQVNVAPTPNGFRRLGLQVTIQFLRIVRVCLRDACICTCLYREI